MYRKSLVVAFVFFILVVLGIQFVTQSYIVSWERQFHFSRKAVQKANLMAQNIKEYTSNIYEFTNVTRLGEIFSNREIRIHRSVSNRIQRIRLTDSSGKIILSTDGLSDVGRFITSNVLELASATKTNFIFFLASQDVLVALGSYENPYTLNSFDKGYIMFEFPASILFESMGTFRYFVKMGDIQPLLIVMDNVSLSYARMISVDPGNSTDSVVGFKLNMPFLNNMIYFIGNDLYVPPILSTLFVILCIFLLWRLFYKKKQLNINVSQDGNITQLVNDINNGTTYPREVAVQMIDNGAKFGNVNFDELKFEENNTLYFDSKNEFTIPGEVIEDESLDISIPKSSESIDGLEANLSSESYVSEPELLNIGEDGSDLIVSRDESQTILNVTDPNMSFYLEQDSGKSMSAMQRVENDLKKMGVEFNISHQAMASLKDGLYIFQNAGAFGKEFIISQTDPIFQEFLSEGRALRVSGALQNSEYIRSLFSDSILDRISEVFIIPILNNEKQVEGITVLAREQDQPLLTLEQKLRLFKI